MTQTNLLELAKDGNPQAIATLMNLVLEPKGVTAKASLKENCLHIFFTSEQLLSKATIASFVQSGLKTLGARSFGKVRLYAQKVGQAAPIWVDEWVIEQAFSSNPVAATSAIAPPPTAPLPVVQPQPAISNSVPAIAPKQSRKRTLSQAAKRPTPPRSKPQARQLQRLIYPALWQRFRISRRSAITFGMGIGAFLIGGGVAATIHSHANSRSQTPTTSTAAAIAGVPNQPSISTNSSPANATEAQAEQYLRQMNKAQQAFYQSNQRFAATLEELERSASIISHSSHYSYRLVIRDQTQSVLTATPKTNDLRSYAGTVLLAQDSAGSDAAVGIICKTHRASTFPPVLPQPTSAPIQCPTDSASVAN